METIFIQIASYRDSELKPTIKHCLERAKYPERLKFGIVWQHGSEENLDEYKNDKRFKILDIPYEQSKGACWARHEGQKLYSEETFSLQLDSHMRFVENWDEQLIEIWKSVEDPKAIITGYPPNYNPSMKEHEWYNVPQICNVYRFVHKDIGARPCNLPNWQQVTRPVKGVFISAGFLFGPGEINKTVPYDPDLYFTGEECSMTVRYFTHGYNFYHSHKVVVYHFYQRLNYKKHWSDHYGEYANNITRADNRLENLLNRMNTIDLGIYGVGNVRTLKDYEIYSGINFAKKLVHKDTAQGIEPPCSNSDKGWENDIVDFKETLCWDYDKVPKCEDPRFWAMIILDQDSIAIHREDLSYNNFKSIIDGNQTSKLFSFEREKTKQIPTYLLIWPYSESKGWFEKAYLPIIKSVR